MKKLMFLFLFVCVNLFAQERILLDIVKNVSLNQTQKTINSAKALQNEFNDKNFTLFLQDWKKTEAVYLAGSIDEDYLDTPRYIDVFNNLNEDLNAQMQRVIDSNSEIKNALFKNSFKTINALEYVYYNNKDLSQREVDIAKEILNSIISNLEDMKEVYSSFEESNKDEIEENALVINAVIASSYRLKEWRIGNPAGLSAKYKNNPNNSRAEYLTSQNSFNAIYAILEAMQDIITKKEFKNLYTLATNDSQKKDLNLANSLIEEMKTELVNLGKDDFSKAQNLFEKASQLHDLFYATIIQKLGLIPTILDADGD